MICTNCLTWPVSFEGEICQNCFREYVGIDASLKFEPVTRDDFSEGLTNYVGGLHREISTAMGIREYRVIKPVYAGQMVALDEHVSDRVFPDIEQMMLDCSQVNR